MGGCCTLLRCSIHCPYLNLSLLQLTALGGEQSTFLRNDSTFVSSSTCFHLTSHILHVTHMLSFCPPLLSSPLLCSTLSSLFSSPLLPSPPYFSADNCQPSHAVHLLCFWRRPSESPYTHTLSSLLPSPFLPHFLTLPFFLYGSLNLTLALFHHFSSCISFLLSCPLSLSVSVNITHFISGLSFRGPLPVSFNS